MKKRSLPWKYNPQELVTCSPNLTRYRAKHIVTGQKGIITFFHFLPEDEKGKLLIYIQHVSKALHFYDARLPNIAKILDYGEEKGELYFVEERIEGASIRETYTRHGAMPLAEVLSLSRQMMHVFQFMHKTAICHSGISSMHIIKKQQPSPDPQAPVAPAQESAFFLTGWNFDRPVDETPALTGYPGLASEMFETTTRDRRGEDSDRHALAAVLYEALTGGLSIKQEKEDDRSTTDRYVQEHVNVDAVPQPLQDVFRKALSKQPWNQYKTIREFFIDFEKVCGEINPSLLLPVVSAPSSEQSLAQPPRGGIPRRTVIKTGIAVAGLALAAWGFSEVEQAIASSHPRSAHTPGTSHQLGDLIVSFEQHHATVNAAIPSPDGSKIASVDASSRLILWSVIDGYSWDDPFKHQTKSITDVAWDPTSTLFGTGDTSGGLVLWSAQDGPISGYYSLPASSQAVAWASSLDPSRDHLLAVGGNQVYIFDNPARENLRQTDFPYNRQTGLINALAIAPDGLNAVSVSNDCTAQVWTIETRTKLYAIPCASLGELSSVAYSPDGLRIAIGSVKGSVYIWDVKSRKFTYSYKHTGAVRKVAWSPDSRSLASGGDDNVVLVYNVDSKGKGKLYYPYRGHNDNVLSVTWYSNKLIISAAGTKIHIWRARL